ncbi:MAG: redoxin domain-containing protein [Candidatus Eisenbacteria bacterium]
MRVTVRVQQLVAMAFLVASGLGSFMPAVARADVNDADDPRLVATGTKASSAPRSAVCLVCAVKEGATEVEAVKASRTYQGREYGFCSAACAKAFDADPAAFVPASLPRPVPGFKVRDLDGRLVSSASLRGKITLLDFWATWCVPCVKNAPELNRLHREWSGRGFQVLGISIDEGGVKKVRPFLKRHAVKYPLVVDSEKPSAWSSFRVKAVPAAYLIDAEGNIVRQWLGRVDPAEVEKALTGMLGPKS